MGAGGAGSPSLPGSAVVGQGGHVGHWGEGGAVGVPGQVGRSWLLLLLPAGWGGSQQPEVGGREGSHATAASAASDWGLQSGGAAGRHSSQQVQQGAASQGAGSWGAGGNGAWVWQQHGHSQGPRVRPPRGGAAPAAAAIEAPGAIHWALDGGSGAREGQGVGQEGALAAVLWGVVANWQHIQVGVAGWVVEALRCAGSCCGVIAASCCCCCCSAGGRPCCCLLTPHALHLEVQRDADCELLCAALAAAAAAAAAWHLQANGNGGSVQSLCCAVHVKAGHAPAGAWGNGEGGSAASSAAQGPQRQGAAAVQGCWAHPGHCEHLCVGVVQRHAALPAWGPAPQHCSARLGLHLVGAGDGCASKGQRRSARASASRGAGLQQAMHATGRGGRPGHCHCQGRSAWQRQGQASCEVWHCSQLAL